MQGYTLTGESRKFKATEATKSPAGQKTRDVDGREGGMLRDDGGKFSDSFG